LVFTHRRRRCRILRTIGRDISAGSPEEVSVHGIWSPFLRLKSITYRDLVAVRLSLEDALVQSRISGDNSLLLLHVDNMTVFHIVSSTVPSKPELMTELWHLPQALKAMNITIRASRFPSTMNKHVDRLNRCSNPRDPAATLFLLQSVAESLQLQTVRRFSASRRWTSSTASGNDRSVLRELGDGRSHLWNPPLPWIWETLLKIKEKGAHGTIVVPC